MNIDIESEIIRVIDIEIKGLSLLQKQIDSSVKSAVEQYSTVVEKLSSQEWESMVW
jgi:hypothetical protein